MTFSMILKKISQFVKKFLLCVWSLSTLGEKICEFMQIVKLPHY
jgi:hypothetical protein